MRSGWTKNWRKKWDNPTLKGRPNHILVWDWLLSFAEWREESKRADVRFNGKVIKLNLGQLTCGSFQIAEYTGCAPSTIARVINDLVSEKLIEKQTDNRCSLITVINWELYQGDEKQMRNKRETDEKQMRTNKEDKKYKNNKNTTDMSAFADERPEVINEIESELRKFLPFVSKILGSEKTFSIKALSKWKTRRLKYSARELAESFLNLQREPDLWKVKNNGWRPISWWLRSDEYILELQNCHLKGGNGRMLNADV